MFYSRYGITFRLLKESDIELVRNWRNDPVVANNHEFREYITSWMQAEWFASINNINNLYTIIEYQSEKIGVINIKNIDWEQKSCEGGIFIPYPKYHQSFLPGIISYITTEIIFSVFDWNVSYARVLKENKSVRGFVRMLGYELMPDQEEVVNQRYCVTREQFEKKAPKLLKAMSVLVSDTGPGIFVIEKDEFDNALVLDWEGRVKHSSRMIRVREEEIGRVYYFN